MKNCFSETKASELVKEINTSTENLKEVVLNYGCKINPTDSNLESQYLKEFDLYFKKLKEFHSSASNMIESVKKEIYRDIAKVAFTDLVFAILGVLITYFLTDEKYIAFLYFIASIVIFFIINLKISQAFGKYYAKRLREIREPYRAYCRAMLLFKAFIRNPGKRIFNKDNCIDYINGDILVGEINRYLNRADKEHLEKYPLRDFCL